MFGWFKKKKEEEPKKILDWNELTFSIEGKSVKFSEHFYLNTNHDICMLPNSRLIHMPFYDKTYFSEVKVGDKITNEHKLAEALSINRAVYHEYIYGKVDESCVQHIVSDAKECLVNLIKLADKFADKQFYFDSSFVESTLHVNSRSSISIHIRPYQVDKYVDMLKEHGCVKYIDEYRKYIIKEIAVESTSNHNYPDFKVQYDIPPTRIMFYFDWEKRHEEQIARDKMNAEYKDIINEIETERKKLKA